MAKTRLYAPQVSRFSRQWWFDGMRNWFFVVLISALVWIYADMEVTMDEQFTVTIVLTTRNSPELILRSAQRLEIDFTLRGTRRSLAKFQEVLDEKNASLEYDVSADFEAGENNISTETLLENAANLAEFSLLVHETKPSRIHFSLDRRVAQPARVVPDTAGASFTREPDVIPAEVTVYLAQSDLDKLRKDQSLAPGEPITLSTPQIDLRNSPTGEPYTVSVEVLPPAAEFPVAIQPKTVRVTFEIDQRTDDRIFPVTIHVSAPYTWTEDDTWSQYQMIKRDTMEWRPKITVRGAKKDLDQLRTEQIDALVVLTEDDKTPVASWLPRKVSIRFPKGMAVELVGEAPTVHFKLAKRSPGPSTP